ncbi:MAG: methyltransferase domain-containing protein [Nitrospinae bacterium]|nr:methyltransferase domain-containing protein [Nitrospinota bacterium]
MFRSEVELRKLFSNDRVALFIISLLSLYIEVMLIRHLGSEIRIFAYFKNLTLIGAFLGLGVGYLYKPRLSPLVTLGCITFIAVTTHPITGFYQISDFLNLGDFNMWEMAHNDVIRAMAGLLMLTTLFFAVIISMAPLGQALSDIFDRSQNRILDYSINIAGSLIGVWFFAGLSFETTPPTLWYLIATAIIFALWRWDTQKSLAVAVSAMIMIMALNHVPALAPLEQIWSPYQKISLHQFGVRYNASSGDTKIIEYKKLQTNNTLYLYMLDLSDKNRKAHPDPFPPALDRYHYYDLPYNFPNRLDDVLVLGSGGGNDVAGALRAGAKRVTAVEIDPTIISLGRKYHPENPYGSERVTVVNNDARNFLRDTDRKYDLIILGLLDSHTLTSSFSNTNLDSFMYTTESVGDMRRHLKPDGVLALSFQVNYPWIGSKIYKMINQQFGRPPVVIQAYSRHFIQGTGGTYFLASEDEKLVMDKVKADPMLSRRVEFGAKAVEVYKNLDAKPQTDDWPYLYVQSRSIPKLHLLVSALLISIFLLIYGFYFGKPRRNDIHFAALGAGFLLLEVSVISRFALFWGTTWLVSSIVISLILAAILAANATFIKSAGRVGYPVLYGVLFVALAGLYFLPLTSNWVVALYMAPFVVIGYLFAKSFNGAAAASRALAYNLFGALFGGLSESLSFVTGLSGLIILAIAFYAVSFFTAGGEG